jgi:hypothetical protein
VPWGVAFAVGTIIAYYFDDKGTWAGFDLALGNFGIVESYIDNEFLNWGETVCRIG